MGSEAMTAVWEHAECTPGQRTVMLALAERADEHGICWPGITKLVEKTKLSRRGVQYALRALEKSGQLERVQDEEGGRGITPLYWLKLPGLDGEIEDALRRRGKGANGRLKGANARQESPERAQSEDLKGAAFAPEPKGNEEASDEASSPPTPTTGQVVVVLEAVATARGAPKPTAASVDKAIAAFPDRDHLAVVGELEFWAVHGNGRRRKLRSVAQLYRNFLSKADPAPRREEQRSVTDRRHQALRTLSGRNAA